MAGPPNIDHPRSPVGSFHALVAHPQAYTFFRDSTLLTDRYSSDGVLRMRQLNADLETIARAEATGDSADGRVVRLVLDAIHKHNVSSIDALRLALGVANFTLLMIVLHLRDDEGLFQLLLQTNEPSLFATLSARLQAYGITPETIGDFRHQLETVGGPSSGLFERFEHLFTIAAQRGLWENQQSAALQLLANLVTVDKDGQTYRLAQHFRAMVQNPGVASPHPPGREGEVPTWMMNRVGAQMLEGLQRYLAHDLQHTHDAAELIAYDDPAMHPRFQLPEEIVIHEGEKLVVPDDFLPAYVSVRSIDITTEVIGWSPAWEGYYSPDGHQVVAAHHGWIDRSWSDEHINFYLHAFQNAEGRLPEYTTTLRFVANMKGVGPIASATTRLKVINQIDSLARGGEEEGRFTETRQRRAPESNAAVVNMPAPTPAPVATIRATLGPGEAVEIPTQALEKVVTQPNTTAVFATKEHLYLMIRLPRPIDEYTVHVDDVLKNLATDLNSVGLEGTIERQWSKFIPLAVAGTGGGYVYISRSPMDPWTKPGTYQLAALESSARVVVEHREENYRAEFPISGQVVIPKSDKPIAVTLGAAEIFPDRVRLPLHITNRSGPFIGQPLNVRMAIRDAFASHNSTDITDLRLTTTVSAIFDQQVGGEERYWIDIPLDQAWRSRGALALSIALPLGRGSRAVWADLATEMDVPGSAAVNQTIFNQFRVEVPPVPSPFPWFLVNTASPNLALRTALQSATHQLTYNAYVSSRIVLDLAHFPEWQSVDPQEQRLTLLAKLLNEERAIARGIIGGRGYISGQSTFDLPVTLGQVTTTWHAALSWRTAWNMISVAGYPDGKDLLKGTGPDKEPDYTTSLREAEVLAQMIQKTVTVKERVVGAGDTVHVRIAFSQAKGAHEFQRFFRINNSAIVLKVIPINTSAKAAATFILPADDIDYDDAALELTFRIPASLPGGLFTATLAGDHPIYGQYLISYAPYDDRTLTKEQTIVLVDAKNTWPLPLEVRGDPKNGTLEGVGGTVKLPRE